jgi:hypothetical protein
MSFFLVGGGYDEVLDDVYDAFIEEARPFGPSARIAVVVSGPPEVSGARADQLFQIVSSRWPEAEILPIHLTGPGTCPPAEHSETDDAPEPTRSHKPAQSPGPLTSPEPRWTEDPGFTLPEGLDQLAGIIVGGGRVPGYLAGLGPAADQLSRLVRGGAPWLGFSAGAMVTAVTAIQGGWRLQDRQIAPRPDTAQQPDTAQRPDTAQLPHTAQQSTAKTPGELSLAEGLGLVSVTSLAHNDTGSGDGLLLSAVEAGLLGSAVAIDEGTCLRVHHSSGRTQVLGSGLVRWFRRTPDGVLVRSERSPHKEVPPAPPAPRFEGLARVAAATRAARAERGE